MRLKSHALLARCALVAGLLLGATSARAQSIDLERFRPAPLASDGFAVTGTRSQGHLGLNVALHFDYAYEPLIVELATGDQYAVVSNQASLHLAFALGLGTRTTVFATFPVHTVLRGDEPPRGIVTRLPPTEGAGLGDAHLGARVRLVGDERSRAVLAAQAVIALPFASVTSSQHYSGDDMLGFEPRLALDVHLDRTTFRANLGGRVRKDEQLANTTVGDELTFGLGVQHALAHDRVRLIAELFGASGFKHFGQSAASPLEALLGAKFLHPAGYHGAVAVGPGITSGVGTPELRALVTLGYARPGRPPATPRPPPSERKKVPVK